MTQKVLLITINGDDFFHCDDDGYVLLFDNEEQILQWAEQNGVDPDAITYYEEETIDE